MNTLSTTKLPDLATLPSKPSYTSQNATPTPPSINVSYPDSLSVPATLTAIPTAQPVIATTIIKQPTVNSSVSVATLECSIIDDTFSECVDPLLGIKFRIPVAVSTINTIFTNHDVEIDGYPLETGHSYSYRFGDGPELQNFNSLDAIGWGNGYSKSTDGGNLFPRFIGCAGATICEEIAPNILLTFHFPNTRNLCDSAPGMTYVAFGSVVVHLPDNPQVDVFYFTGPTINNELNDELVSILVDLESYERKCNEDTIQRFNARLGEITVQVENKTLDEKSNQNITTLYQIANSIEFVDQQ